MKEKYGCGHDAWGVSMKVGFQEPLRGLWCPLLLVVSHLGSSWNSVFQATQQLTDYLDAGIHYIGIVYAFLGMNFIYLTSSFWVWFNITLIWLIKLIDPCLQNYRLGSKVAMFRYSSVEIYAACKPPPVIDFSNTKGLEWLQREAKDVSHLDELS